MELIIIHGPAASGKTTFIRKVAASDAVLINPNVLSSLKGVALTLGGKELVFEEITESNFAQVVSWLACDYNWYPKVYISTQDEKLAGRMANLFQRDFDDYQELSNKNDLGKVYKLNLVKLPL